MLNDFPDVLSVEQLANILNIGINTAYRLIHTGEIGYKRIGRRILIPKICVVDYLDLARYNESAIAAGDCQKGGEQ